MPQHANHIRDPLLTDTGKTQCQQLQNNLPSLRDIDLILASPLRRTVQTAAYVFAPELERRQLPIILVPNAQEISPLTCDIGYDAKVTKSEAPNLIADAAPLWKPENLDTTLVDESWNSKVNITFLLRNSSSLSDVVLLINPRKDLLRPH